MNCDRCGASMTEEHDGVRVYRCIICGNRVYPDYPRRLGDQEVCRICGKEFASNYGRIHCEECVASTRKSIRSLGREAQCPKCGKKFIISKARQVYCSYACYRKIKALKMKHYAEKLKLKSSGIKV